MANAPVKMGRDLFSSTTRPTEAQELCQLRRGESTEPPPKQQIKCRRHAKKGTSSIGCPEFAVLGLQYDQGADFALGFCGNIELSVTATEEGRPESMHRIERGANMIRKLRSGGNRLYSQKTDPKTHKRR